MTSVLVVARREIFSFFVSPMAYVLLLVWLLFSGLSFYWLAVVFATQPIMSAGASANPLTAFFGGTTLFYLPLFVFAPVMTMRLLAEERSSGTLECLLTAPVTEVELVFGKYLAAVFFWCVLWLPTLVYVWLAASAGEGAVDPGVIGATYLGLFCIGLFYMAVGLLMSAMSRNQVVAATLTFLVLAGLFLLGLGQFVLQDEKSQPVFEYIGLWTQMEAFAKGVVDTRYLTYDLSLAILCIFLSVRAVQANRWQ
jgi:ABC-2 type transport system permease protein